MNEGKGDKRRIMWPEKVQRVRTQITGKSIYIRQERSVSPSEESRTV